MKEVVAVLENVVAPAHRKPDGRRHSPQNIPEPSERVHEPQIKCITPVKGSALANEVVQTATMAENRNHPTITQSEDFDKYEPNERLSAEDVVQTAITAENPVQEQGISYDYPIRRF